MIKKSTLLFGGMLATALAPVTLSLLPVGFFNAWDPATQKALVDHCVVGGLQCDARGYDQTHPEAGAALNENYELP